MMGHSKNNCLPSPPKNMSANSKSSKSEKEKTKLSLPLKKRRGLAVEKIHQISFIHLQSLQAERSSKYGQLEEQTIEEEGNQKEEKSLDHEVN